LLDDYNDKAIDEDHKIKYTDITGILMSSVQTIISGVTYVLIAFVSISLIVSSIMIAVITLISVMERTKEIGILRAMGASKHNVSSIFSAETFIIGLLSGVIGVCTSWILIVPINNIIHKLTDATKINAVLELRAAIVLVIISVVLTIVAGFIPSKKAAKQDPVIALRSE
jgi:putative ABC transport system permease protein